VTGHKALGVSGTMCWNLVIDAVCIERLMRAQALKARPRRRGLPVDRGQRSAIADNVLDRQFQADGPNQKWVADFTYI
jgi:putative transposase